MITVTLVKFRRRPTAEEVDQAPKLIAQSSGKILSSYWTLGRFDAVVTVEWNDEKQAMGAWSKLMDVASTETLLAVPRAEAIKLAGY